MNIIEAKPTTYKGTTFRSKSEARLAVMFDLAGFSWEYEPRCFSRDEWDDHKGWHPDFLLTITHPFKYSYMIEYKPCYPTNDYWKWLLRESSELLPMFQDCYPDHFILDSMLLILPMYKEELPYEEWGMPFIDQSIGKRETTLLSLAASPIYHAVLHFRAKALQYRFDLK